MCDAPSGIRTRATTLKGWRPGPLVDGGGRTRIAAGERSQAPRAVSLRGVNDSNEGCADTSADARRIRTDARGTPPGARRPIDLGTGRTTVKRAPAATAPASQQRTIGEILLEHGYVTEDDLDAAIQRQQETGFPLGQILVEAGAITRLELASALAVQWADVTPAKPPSDGPPSEERARSSRQTEARVDEQLFAYAGQPPDDAWREEVRGAARAFAQRLDALENAVDELRENDGPETGNVDVDVEGAIAPVAGRVDQAVDRVSALESALAELRSRQDETLTALAGVREDLTRRAASVTTALESLADQVGRSAPAEAVDELRVAVAALAARPTGDDALSAALEALAGRVDSLGAQVEALADPTALEELRGALNSMAERPAADPALAARVETLAAQVEALADPTALEDLRRALDSLDERPTSDPVLAGRIEELAGQIAQLAERPAADPELASRLDELAAQPSIDPAIADRLDELAGRLEEIALRPQGDPDAAERLEELAARVDALADPTALEELRRALDSLVERPASDPVLAGRLDELAEGVEALAQAPSSDPDLAVRVGELSARIDALADGSPGEHSPGSSNELGARIAALETRIAELVERPEAAPAAATAEGRETAGTGEISGREFDRLCFAVERVSLQLTEHHRAIDMLMNGDGAGRANGQLDALVARIEALELRGAAARPAGSASDAAPVAAGDGAGFQGELHELARRIAEIDEASRLGREKLLTQIEQMMSSIDWRFQRLESGGKAA